MRNRLLVCWLLLHGLLAGQSAVKKTVCASGCDYAATRAGFTSALSAAAAAQASTCAPYIIEIAAGTVIEISEGSVILPTKTCKQYVTIRSNGAGAFTDGVRLNPSTQSSSLAILKATAYVASTIKLSDAGKTSYWRFEGIDFWTFGGSVDGPNYYGLWLGGDGTSLLMDPSTRPDHFEVKHCWFRGTPGARNLLNGIGISGSNIRVLDSYFEAIAGAPGEGHAIGIGISDGPVEIRNNRLSGASQDVLVGGLVYPAGVIPSFLTFTGNLLTRDPYYRFMSYESDPTVACRVGNVARNTATSHDWICNSSGVWVDQGDLTANGWAVSKTIWEAKIGRGVRFHGNLFEGAWFPSSWTTPAFITLNMTSQVDTAAELEPWLTTEDVRIWGNKFHDGNTIFKAGYTIGKACHPGNPAPCYYSGHNNIRMWDNLGYNLGDERDQLPGVSGTFGFVSFDEGDFDFEYRNNTFLLSNTTENSGLSYQMGYGWQNFTPGDKGPLRRLWGHNILRDNIAFSGARGVWGALVPGGFSLGECTISAALSDAGGYDARSNIWTVDKPWAWARAGGVKSPLTCADLTIPEASTDTTDWQFWWKTGYVVKDWWTTVVDSETYKVLPAYQGTGSDGRDPGANIDFVNWATAGAATGAANPFLEMKIRSIRSSSNVAIIYVTAPSSNACAVELSQSNRFDTLAGSVEYLQSGKDVRANVSGLTPGTYYFVRARCDGYQLESALRTSP